MNHDEMNKAYTTFFTESPAGLKFKEELLRLITDAHEKAEDNPELARDYTQHAKGIRQVIAHIDSVSTPIKKGRK